MKHLLHLKAPFINKDIILWSSLLILSLIQPLWKSLAIYLLNNYPNTDEIHIFSQIMWLDIIYEVLQESLLLPLIFYLSQKCNHDVWVNKIRSFLLLIVGFYVGLNFILYIFSDTIICYISNNLGLLENIKIYLGLESFNKLLETLFLFFTAICIILGHYKSLFILILITLAGLLLSGFILIDRLSLGVMGVAYCNLFIYAVSNIVLFIFINHKCCILDKCVKFSFTWIYKKQNFLAGLDSLVRNIFYALIILQTINKMDKITDYFMIATFFWVWLLLPVFKLGDIISKNIAKDTKDSIGKYFIYSSCLVVLWIILIPLYKPFLQYIMNVANYNEIFLYILISLPFYIIFAYGNIITSIFKGAGRFDLILLQTIITNSCIGIILYVLYQLQSFKPELLDVLSLFGGTLVIGTFFNFMIYFKYKKHNNL